ncbi:MAG: sulfite exporter TauE/SafE family protein [Verrucomicrobiales bacterium]|nr:sulfite exporter TauE/SafE family protein [Verrucomicrobiales bacterium]MCP5527758.1 sulfite exporter TauE/SafE family protein [Verrucomicrobiales bacterium]
MRRNRPRPLLPFLIWLAAFYGTWLALLVFGRHGRELVAHAGIALAMLFGSYIAGSTPMGGGTVGFPILVLLLDQPAALGRDFSFAVQSIGMVSASIFILCRRQELEWPMLRWALVGSLIGTPLGILGVAPLVPALWIKLIFAVTWASFGVMHLVKVRELVANVGMTPAAHRFDRNAGLLVGLLGGSTVAAVTGVGIDMLIYVVLVLLCRADLKIAIPTSVLLMAFTSLVGIVTKLLVTGVQPEVFGNWLAAAPVVALGAPLGAWVVTRVGRTPTLILVSLLCLGQFAWTVQQEWGALGWTGLIGALAVVGGLNLGFRQLYVIGLRLARRGGTPGGNALASAPAGPAESGA